MLYLIKRITICAEDVNRVFLIISDLLKVLTIIVPIIICCIGIYFFIKWLKNKKEKILIKKFISMLLLSVSSFIVLGLIFAGYEYFVNPYEYDSRSNCWIYKN